MKIAQLELNNKKECLLVCREQTDLSFNTDFMNSAVQIIVWVETVSKMFFASLKTAITVNSTILLSIPKPKCCCCSVV